MIVPEPEQNSTIKSLCSNLFPVADLSQSGPSRGEEGSHSQRGKPRGHVMRGGVPGAGLKTDVQCCAGFLGTNMRIEEGFQQARSSYVP